MSPSRESPRTLVVAPNWVGDCVMAEPVFRALAASGRELTVLARKPLHTLLALFPGLDAPAAYAYDHELRPADRQPLPVFERP